MNFMDDFQPNTWAEKESAERIVKALERAYDMMSTHRHTFCERGSQRERVAFASVDEVISLLVQWDGFATNWFDNETEFEDE